MPNVNKVNLLSERTSGVPPVIFVNNNNEVEDGYYNDDGFEKGDDDDHAIKIKLFRAKTL